MHLWGGGRGPCRKFMEYLLNAPQSIHINQKAAYQFCGRLLVGFPVPSSTAYRDGKIKRTPNGFLDRIECIPTMRDIWAKRNWYGLPKRPVRKRFLKKLSFACLNGTEEERHQAAHLAADTAVHQRQDVRDHPYAETKADCAQPHQWWSLRTARRTGRRTYLWGLQGQDAARTPQRWLLAAGITKEDNLPLYPAFIPEACTWKWERTWLSSSLSRTQEHYHHTDLFQDGSTADVRWWTR